MAFAEMDNCFVRAIRSLHSATSESQNNIRVLLDEALKSKYGPGKELGPYVNYSAVFHEHPPVISTGTSITTIETSLKDEIKDVDSSDNDLELDLLKEDLLCVVCKGMGVGARNRLSECSDCHNLYHQECHDPTISDEEIEITGWLCTACKDAQAKAAKKPIQSPVSVTSSHKSSPTNSLSTAKSYSDKDFPEVGSTKLLGSKSSSSSSSSTSSKSSSVPNRVMTPNINLVSADKRLQIMKKKAAKMQEKRKLSR